MTWALMNECFPPPRDGDGVSQSNSNPNYDMGTYLLGRLPHPSLGLLICKKKKNGACPGPACADRLS